jgi:hypothetical protein
MVSKELNKKVSFTKKDRDLIINELVGAGINKKTVEEALATLVEGCSKMDNCENSCKDYYRVEGAKGKRDCDIYITDCKIHAHHRGTFDNLLREMEQKGVSPKAMSPAVRKFFE